MPTQPFAVASDAETQRRKRPDRRKSSIAAFMRENCWLQGHNVPVGSLLLQDEMIHEISGGTQASTAPAGFLPSPALGCFPSATIQTASGGLRRVPIYTYGRIGAEARNRVAAVGRWVGALGYTLAPEWGAKASFIQGKSVDARAK